MKTNYQFQYNLTHAELRELSNDLHVRAHGGGSSAIGLIVIFASIALTFYTIWSQLPRSMADTDIRALIGTGFILTAVILFLGLNWWRNRKARAANPHWDVFIGKENLVITLRGDSVTVGWPALARCYQTDNLIVLASKDAQPLVTLPKRVFESQAMVDGFEQFVRIQMRDLGDKVTPASVESTQPDGLGTESDDFVLIDQKTTFMDCLLAVRKSELFRFILLFCFLLILVFLGLFLFTPRTPDAPPPTIATYMFLFGFVLCSPIAIGTSLLLLLSYLLWRESVKSGAAQICLRADSVYSKTNDTQIKIEVGPQKQWRETFNSFALYDLTAQVCQIEIQKSCIGDETSMHKVRRLMKL